MSRTYEELKAGFERIEAAQACRNLMGKYSYLHTAMRNIDFMNLWANREDDILAMPWGYYLGIEGVENAIWKIMETEVILRYRTVRSLKAA